MLGKSAKMSKEEGSYSMLVLFLVEFRPIRVVSSTKSNLFLVESANQSVHSTKNYVTIHDSEDLLNHQLASSIPKSPEIDHNNAT